MKLDWCDSALPKPVDTVTVADLDTEELVHNSLVVILKLNVGQDIEAELCSRFEEQIFWGWVLVKISKSKFDQDFETEHFGRVFEATVWSRF